MDVNIGFKADTFANEMLRTMGNYVAGQAVGGRPGHLTTLVANGRVRLIEGGVEQTGKNGWAGRSAADKQQNDEMRSAFLKSLANELGLKGDSETLVARLEALFGRDVFKSGDYGKGRPLTMRRVTAVLNKVDEAKRQLLTERVSAAFDRLAENGPRLEEVMKATLAKRDLGIGRDVAKAVLAQVSQFVEKACTGAATTLDLEEICRAALATLKTFVGPERAESQKALTEKLQAALGGPDSPFGKLVDRIKRDATLCLAGRAQFRGEYFAQHYSRQDVEPLIARFSAVLGNDAQKCRMYVLIRLLIDDEIKEKEISAKYVQAYTCSRLCEFGVTEDEARQLWNVENLKMRSAQKVNSSELTAGAVHKLVDGEVVSGLSLLLGVPATSERLSELAGRLKADCPTFGESLLTYGKQVRSLAKGLTNLGTTLLKRVGAERPNLTTPQKLAAVARMLQTIKAVVSEQVEKGEIDLEAAIQRAAVPMAEELAHPTVEEQVDAFKALLLKYRADFTDERGNANNANGFRSRTRSKLEAILGTLDKVVTMSAVKDRVIAKLEEAKKLVQGDYRKPCNSTAPGREAVRMIEVAMGGAGAHGDINAVGEMAFAVETFCEIPELLRQALEEDARNGNDAGFLELCEALNTDGCVQAYAETIAVVHDKFNGFEAGLDLGSDKVHYTVDVLVGKTFKAVFPKVSADNPISYDDFAERFARFLADHNRGSYEDRLAEIHASKDVLLSFLEDAGVVDRPVLTKTTLFNKVFADPARQTGEVVRDDGDFIWKGLVFRAETRPFSQVLEHGRKAPQPVDGFSSRNDLSVSANLLEAKGLGKGLGATGQSGVSCCRTVNQCIGYASVGETGQGCYLYVIDTTKMGANEKAWDMDSVYDAHGGENPDKTGAEVNASSVRKEAVMGWIKVPARIADINKSANGKSIEETKLQQLKFYVEQHPEAITLNPDFGV